VTYNGIKWRTMVLREEKEREKRQMIEWSRDPRPWLPWQREQFKIAISKNLERVLKGPIKLLEDFFPLAHLPVPTFFACPHKICLFLFHLPTFLALRPAAPALRCYREPDFCLFLSRRRLFFVQRKNPFLSSSGNFQDKKQQWTE